MMSHDDNRVNFLSDIQPSEKNWDTHRAEAESVRLLYSLSTEFTKYASRITTALKSLNLRLPLTNWY